MKKALLFLAAMLIGIDMASAAELFTGVLVTTPDGTTTYALTEMPKITYTTEGTTVTAHLFINSKKDAVASVVLEGGKTLSAVWGTYTPSDIKGVNSDRMTSYMKDGRKYFTGGRLIIVKDSKLYDATGKEFTK